jgi:predicted lipid carrier protein YhbT
VATAEEVEATLQGLIRRLEDVDPSYRAMLPSRRTIEAECPDLGLVYHALWRNGGLSEIEEGSAPRRPDIRLSVDSDDLLALANGRMDVGRAYADGRIRIQASMTDLLRLRAAL